MGRNQCIRERKRMSRCLRQSEFRDEHEQRWRVQADPDYAVPVGYDKGFGLFISSAMETH